jgi:hypothetical protein
MSSELCSLPQQKRRSAPLPKVWEEASRLICVYTLSSTLRSTNIGKSDTDSPIRHLGMIKVHRPIPIDQPQSMYDPRVQPFRPENRCVRGERRRKRGLSRHLSIVEDDHVFAGTRTSDAVDLDIRPGESEFIPSLFFPCPPSRRRGFCQSPFRAETTRTRRSHATPKLTK